MGRNLSPFTSPRIWSGTSWENSRRRVFSRGIVRLDRKTKPSPRPVPRVEAEPRRQQAVAVQALQQHQRRERADYDKQSDRQVHPDVASESAANHGFDSRYERQPSLDDIEVHEQTESDARD